jgi:hypothetical protein
MTMKHLVLCGVFFATVMSKAATPQINAESPIGFFTNVASHLLADANVDFAHIQVYPTNQYTPSVQRLLQVTANLYDATTTNFYPTIFRPYFSGDGTNIFISGYEQVDSTNLSALTTPVTLNSAVGLVSNGTRLNIHGIPWILGAKKGLPNFNEIALQNIFQISRKLQVVRQSPYFFSYKANQMLIVSVSNIFAIETWNSYRTNYPGGIYIQADGNLTITLTNDYGAVVSNNFALNGTISLTGNQWKGRGVSSTPNSQSFQIPLFTNLLFMPDSIYVQHQPGFVPFVGNSSFETNAGFANPHWGLSSRVQIRCAIFDAGPPSRLIDYVQLDGPSAFLDVNAEIQTPDNVIGIGGLWSTNVGNYFFGPTPMGIMNQVEIATGNISSSDADWYNNMINAPFGINRAAAMTAFYNFIYHYSSGTNMTMICPFTPTRKISQTLSWQVNDPLVHYLASDLRDSISQTVFLVPLIGSFSVVPNIGKLNRRYAPWGGYPFGDSDLDPSAFDLSLKDPLIRSSDDWNFPTGQSLSFDWLGRVHRGTPWQTIYLKSQVADPGDWETWTGASDLQQAGLTHPTNDWHTASRWATWLNTNQLASLFSINNPSSSAWQALLDGQIAVTNVSSEEDAVVITPVIITSNSPQALIIADAVQSIRANRPSQLFSDVAGVLMTPELTIDSPWLNRDWFQVQNAINDEAYEKIISQLLPLLRADSIGAVTVNQEQVLGSFTGYDNHAYMVEFSTNLVDWISITTNSPVNGVFTFTNSITPDVALRFYRTILLQ